MYKRLTSRSLQTYSNMMYDRCIIRGNTYGLHILPALFHFDLEVQPILEVLVGKTVEQALLEVMEKEELVSLRQQQRVFEENRNAELVDIQHLERRRKKGKERRMQQKRLALPKERETCEKVPLLGAIYLSDFLPSVFSNLSERGFFYDPEQREVESEFLTWLMDETVKVLDQRI